MKLKLSVFLFTMVSVCSCLAQNYSSSCASGPGGASCEDSEGNISMITCTGSFCTSYSGPNPLEPLLDHIFGFDRRAQRDQNIGLCLKGVLPANDPRCTEPFSMARKEYVKAFNKSVADQFKKQGAPISAVLHADLDGTRFVFHYGDADQMKYERLLATPDFMAPLSVYGFTQFVYTNDRDKTFTSEPITHRGIDPKEAQEREVAASLRKNSSEQSPEVQHIIAETKAQTSMPALSQQAQQAMEIINNPNSTAPYLPASMGSITTIFTDPAGAEIAVDGKSTNGKIRFLLLNKAGAERTITIAMKGYKTVQKKIVPDGKPITFNIKLDKETTESRF